MSSGTKQRDRPAPEQQQAPIREAGQLSPPIVCKPIYECARAAHVKGFIPHALVVVYANKTEVVGHHRPFVGYDDIPLLRALVPGDQITATQSAFGFTSDQSYESVGVEHQPASLDKPTVGPVIYACGQVVPVGGLHPSTDVEVYSAATAPGSHRPGRPGRPSRMHRRLVGVVTSPLKEGWFVAARQAPRSMSCQPSGPQRMM